MMRHTINTMVAMCLAVVLVACDSPKDASKTNFTRALNEHLGKECQLITVGLERTTFPRTIEANGFSDLKQYDALVDAGLLTSKPDTVVTKDLYGNARWSNPAKTYNLTAEGKKQIQVQRGLLGEVSGFCAVKYSVVSINNFTPPQNAMGQTISQVNFTPAAEVRPWTRNAAVQAAFGNNVVAHTEPRVETLLLTEGGWIDARDFGNSPGL